MSLTICPDCHNDVSRAAIACPSCGHPIASQAVRKWNPGIAALLSLVLPGAGQMYKGQVFNGLFWFVLVITGYILFLLPGVILHLVCIVGASLGNPTK